MAILAVIGASFFGLTGQCVVAGAAAVANIIVEDAIPIIYWTDYVYYKTCIPPDPNMFRIKVAEHTQSYIYTDSARNNFVRSYAYWYYDKDYVQ